MPFFLREFLLLMVLKHAPGSSVEKDTPRNIVVRHLCLPVLLPLEFFWKDARRWPLRHPTLPFWRFVFFFPRILCSSSKASLLLTSIFHCELRTCHVSFGHPHILYDCLLVIGERQRGEKNSVQLGIGICFS